MALSSPGAPSTMRNSGRRKPRLMRSSSTVRQASVLSPQPPWPRFPSVPQQAPATQRARQPELGRRCHAKPAFWRLSYGVPLPFIDALVRASVANASEIERAINAFAEQPNGGLVTIQA